MSKQTQADSSIHAAALGAAAPGHLLLLAGSGGAIPLMLGIASLSGIAGLWIARRLHHSSRSRMTA